MPASVHKYDGDGKRVKKETESENTVFVYDALGQFVAEYSNQVASVQQVSYLTADHLGSPRVTTNEIGAVTNRKEFSAFGDEVTSAQRVSGGSGNGYTADEVRKDYTGYEKDTESGLQFAQARYYNTTHGRYTSVDPMTASANIKNPQTFNRYSYVLNSPYKFVDPLGLISVDTGACGSACLGSDGGSMGLISSQSGMDQENVQRVKIAAESQSDQVANTPAMASTTGSEHEERHAQHSDSNFDPPDDIFEESPEARQKYNCLAWALGLTDVWIEPITDLNGNSLSGYVEKRNRAAKFGGDRTEFLADANVPMSMSDTAKRYSAKETVTVDGTKYTATAESEAPKGFYKIVVFDAKKDSHVMRQESDGSWSSKDGSKARTTGITDPASYFAKKVNQGSELKATTYLYRSIKKIGKSN